MRRILKSACIALLTMAPVLSCVSASAQEASAQAGASLQDQLKAQFTVSKACGGANGTVLAVQMDGILGFPAATPRPPATKYQDGKIITPKFNAFTKMLYKDSAPFNAGLKVNVTNLSVNAGEDSVTLGLRDCASNSKAVLVFQFAKGSLQDIGVPGVMDAVGKVFSFDQGGNASAQSQPAPAPQAQEAPQPPDPSAEPPKIQIGESIDDVIAALGQPDKKVDLGAKKIFVYKDIKITFKDGKVADAE